MAGESKCIATEGEEVFPKFFESATRFQLKVDSDVRDFVAFSHEHRDCTTIR